MLANEAAHKDVLDIIAPEDKEKKRKNPPPAQTGVALELCHHCFKEIRSSSTTTASAPIAEPMIIDITETAVPSAGEKPKQAVWLAAAGANSKNRNHQKKAAHKKSSASNPSGAITYSVEAKLDMIKIWKETKDGTGRKPALAAKWRAGERTVRKWVKKEAELQAALDEGRGRKKTCHSDPLRRITHGLNLFYEANSRMPRDLKLPLTGK